MSIPLYANHHVRVEIIEGVRLRGIDVLTAREDQRHEADDAILLARSTELGRVLFSQDRDLLVLAAQFQRSGRFFAGVVYAHQLEVTIGQCVEDLELICGVYEPSEMQNRMIYLPL